LRIACFTTAVSALLLSACGGDSPGPVDPEGPGSVVAISILGVPTDGRLTIGSSMELSSLVVAGRNEPSIAWTTSNPDRASVSPASGATTTVTALSLGEVTITATSGGKSVSKAITVVPRGPSMFLVTPARLGSYPGMEYSLSVTVADADGYPV